MHFAHPHEMDAALCVATWSTIAMHAQHVLTCWKYMDKAAVIKFS